MTRRTLLILALAIASTLLSAWALPLSLLYFGWIRAAPSPDTWWTDGTRGGHYFRDSHTLLDSIDFRRIIFTGGAEAQPYYNQNTPPSWAAVISLDQREGFEEVQTIAYGWPLRAFKAEIWQRWPRPDAPHQPLHVSLPNGEISILVPELQPPEVIRGGVPIHTSAAGRLILPTKPLWSGLLADTASFAAAWLLLLTLIPILRSVARRSKGRCPRCNYHRAGLPPTAPCPECGAG